MAYDTPNWIPFEKGEYWVERAYVVTPSGQAVALENPLLEITESPTGQRRLNGRGMVESLRIVALLEDSDSLDVLLDLGGTFTFRLAEPRISAGKVFSPGVKSTLQFEPRSPWTPIPQNEFETMVAQLALIAE
jgi:hypothetical protein